MPQKYFEKFPTITYSNNEVVDITKRVALLERVSSNPYVFYPYEISPFERADQLSARYYDDAYRSWLLYISNKVVDPYYEWYLHENEFYDYMTKKYGSFYDSQQKIKFYRNEWQNADEIDVSTYNALTVGQKNYWEPKLGVGNRVDGYVRKQVDWESNTNKVIKYTVSNSNNYIIDEIVDVVFDRFNTGRGQVVATSNNSLFLQHVSGQFYTSETVSIAANSYVYGQESQSNMVFTDVLAVANNIAEEELVYWTPVTYYDFENEKNEFNKTIRVIDSSLKQVAADNLENLMRE
jgi:hypothetical protein